MVWTHWLRSRLTRLSGNPKGRRSRSSFPRPTLELLEDRCLLATRVLTPAAPDLLSDTAAGNVQNPASISADGRYIVYAHSAGNLVGGDAGDPLPVTGETVTAGQNMDDLSITNIFLYDRATGKNTLVSHAAGIALTTAHGAALNPVISADGNWVAYVSSGDNLVAGQTAPPPAGSIFELLLQGNFNVYVWNRQTGTSQVVSHVPGLAGTLANGTSGLTHTSVTSIANSVSISAGGEYVTYTSTSDNLIAGMPAGGSSPKANVFVWDRAADANTLLSHTPASATTGGNNSAGSAVISADGTTIAFTTQATNMIAGQANPVGFTVGLFDTVPENVFVTQRTGPTWASHSTALVTHTANPATVPAGATLFTTAALPQGEGGSFGLVYPTLPAPALSADGRSIAYSTTAANLVAGQTGAIGLNVYVYNNDPASPGFRSNILASHVPGNPTASGNSFDRGLDPVNAPAISDDGQYVAFLTDATNLTLPNTSGYNVFLYSRANDSLTRITHASIDLASVPTPPTLSSDGRYVAFTGRATAEIAGLTNLNGLTGVDALLYDRVADSYTLLSRAGGSATTTGNDRAQSPVLSRDASTVAFLDDATNLLPAVINGHASRDTNLGTDLFAYSLNPPVGYQPVAAPGTNAIVTVVPPGMQSLTANSLSQVSPIETVSDDGRFTVFLSQGSNLISGQVDTNNALDVFLYDKTLNTTTLLSHAAGQAARAGDANSSNAVISGDGKTIVFFSYATDLISGVTPGNGGGPQLYLYDNDPAHGSTYGTLRLLSHNALDPLQGSFSQANATLTTPALSFNGKAIAYLSSASDLVPGQTSSDTLGFFGPFINTFLYDNDPASPGFGTNVLVSHTQFSETTTADDFGQALVGVGSSSVAISGDGNIVVFSSDAADLQPIQIPNPGAAQYYVYRRSTRQVQLLSHAAGIANEAGDNSAETGFSLTNNIFPASVSFDGRFTVYYSDASNLVAGQTGTRGPHNVFLYDLTTDSHALVSHASGNFTTAGNNPANTRAFATSNPVITPDGKTIAFANNSTNLLAAALTGQNGQENVYLYDNDPASPGYRSNTLVSHAAGSATTPGAHGGMSPSISNDGRYVAYVDFAPNATDPLNTVYDTADVRLYDRLAAATALPLLISHAMAPPTDVSHGINVAPVIAGASTMPIIVWSGLARTMTPRDFNGQIDVFLWMPDGGQPITDLSITNTTLTGGLPVGTPVGTFSTVDPNPGTTHTYTIVPGPNSGLFVITGDTLRTNTVFPPTSTQTYPVTIRTTSTTGLVYEEEITITITPDLPPVATLLSPPNGSNVTGALVNLQGQGTDSVGTVRGEFYIDGTLRYVDANTTGTYYFGGQPNSWDTTGLADGLHTVRFVVYDTIGQSSEAQITVTVANTPIRVAELRPMSNGFGIEFSSPLNVSVLNLYDTQDSNFGPADVTLTGATTGPVEGSLVIDQTRTEITFISTSGPLPPDTYTVRLRSAPDGFVLPGGIVLAGDRVTDSNYVNVFTIAATPAVVVSVPNFARGPGQTVNVPVAGTGLPLRLSDGSGVQSVGVTLEYNPAQLSITSVSVAPGLPAGATATLTPLGTGMVRITLLSPTAPLAAGPLDFVRLTATVPDTAPYGSKQVLDITDVLINGGDLAARDDDGLHLVIYPGDTTSSAGYSSADAVRAVRVAVGLDSGFASQRLVDPVIVADVTGDGRASSNDATRVLQRSVGLAVPSIPALPGVIPPIVTGGPDPVLSLPTHFRGRPGQTITLPVNLDVSDGLEALDLALSYDTSRLEVVADNGVRVGSLTSDFDLFLPNVDAAAGTIRIVMARTLGTITGRGSGSVVRITFRVRDDAPAGRAIVNLRQSVAGVTTQLNEGGLDLNPDPTDAAGDVLDGRITVVRPRPVIRDVVHVVGRDGLDGFFRRLGASAPIDVVNILNPRARKASFLPVLDG